MGLIRDGRHRPTHACGTVMDPHCAERCGWHICAECAVVLDGQGGVFPTSALGRAEG